MTQLPERELIDKNRLFGTEHLKADLKGRAVRGGAFTLGGQGMSFLLQMASTVILARLLTPQDYGLIAMITAVTGFVALFKDLGLSMATVQKDIITHEQISTLFWINVALSVIVMLVALALAPAIAWFSGEPKLQPLTLVMAVGFVFGGLCAQHSALLRRQMRFGTLALIDILQLAVSVVVGIITALAGAGVWALVYMTLSGSLFNAVAVWIVCRWRPSLPVRHAGVRSMLGFGANLTGFNILNYFARNLDNVLIGRVCGSVSLGLYAKAYGLLMFPITQITAPITSVAVPALSRLQNDPEQYKRYYYRAINVIAFITMPLVLILAALSKEIILIVLGDQWVGAARIFKVLAFVALIQPIGANPTGWVFVSLGQTDRFLRWGMFIVPITIASFVIGLPWGVLGVALSYMICGYLMLVPCLWWAFRCSPLSIYGWLRAIGRPLILSLTIYMAIQLLRNNFTFESPILGVMWSSVTAACVLILLLTLWRGMRDEVFDNVRLLRALRGPQPSRWSVQSPA
jgi:PST family polysaccharide transporter